MREREELSAWEREYLSSKITGWKVVSFFFPGLWQIWSRRRWLFWGWTLLAVWLGLLAVAAWDGEGTEAAGFLSWLINVILTLVKFTEKAYRHDTPYFQRYLDEYAILSGRTSNTKNVSEIDKSHRTNENKNAKFDKYWFDEYWYNREWYDAYWFDKEWYNREWYNEEWFDRNWFDKNWYNYKWFDKDWYDKNGYDRRWFNKEWLDKDGYDEYGDKKETMKKTTIKKATTKKAKK